MTEPSVAVASPVFTLDGEVVPALARDCVRMQVSEGVEGLRTLEVELLATGSGTTGPPDRLMHLDGGTVDLGKELRVALGPDSRQRYIFAGAVSALEVLLDDGVPPRVVVLAEDALMGLRMTRRARSWRQLSDQDLAAAIAREHGLSADVQARGPTYDVVQQVNQSDLAFLRERARLVRAELWCTDRTLHFRDRTSRQGTELTLVRGSELLSVRIAADLAHQRSEVIVTGYDAEQKRIVDERAGADVVEAESTGGRAGPNVVRQALGASTTLRVREAALSAEEGAAWARAEMLRRGRRFVTVVGHTNGSPDMVVGSRLTLERVGAPFDGDGYYVTGICHTFDLRRGFRTRFEAERAKLNSVA
jgi:uncharacterized protein